MRSRTTPTQSRKHQRLEDDPASKDTQLEQTGHPVLVRALDAHRGDLAASSGVRPGGLRFSDGFLGDARRAGLTAGDVKEVLASGVRRRCWDGCLAVHDWLQGVELTLDPTGRFGLSARRTGECG